MRIDGKCMVTIRETISKTVIAVLDCKSGWCWLSSTKLETLLCVHNILLT